MKKLLLLSALVIFACSSDDSSDNNDDTTQLFLEKYDGILLAVSHDKFSLIDIKSLKKDSNSIVYDLKGFLPRNIVDSRL